MQIAAGDGDKSTPSAVPWPATRYAWYAVAILGIANLFSFIDRFMLNLLVGPIKETFGITDTEISLLQGVAFGVFYTLLGVPVGRLADRYSRRMIVGFGIALWSVMTGLFGMARTYSELFICRVGVGVGETTVNPCSISMISDYFPEETRSRALGTYAMAAFAGGGLAIVLGGTLVAWLEQQGQISLPLIGELEAWQLAFVCVGFPGVLVALLMGTVKEPERRELLGLASDRKSLPFRVIGRALLKDRIAYGALFLGFSLLSLNGYATMSWMPEFFIRTHDWSMSEVALNYGFVYFVFAGAGAGAFAGGWFGDYLKKRGYRDACLRAAVIGAIIHFPVAVAGPLVDNSTLALAIIAIAVFFNSFPFALAANAITSLAPNEMRAQTMALHLTIVNIVGVGLGPTLTAMLTDYVFADEAYLRYSLTIVGAITLPAAALILSLGLPAYRKALERQR